MTGWRVGYSAAPVELTKAMNKIQSQSTSHTSSISQAAAIAALNGPLDFLATRNKTFMERRNLVVSMINQADGIDCLTPEALFMSTPNAGTHWKNHAWWGGVTIGR